MTTFIGGETAYYQPPVYSVRECECGGCEDYPACEVPGQVIAAARDYLRSLDDADLPAIEAMFPVQVVREVEEAFGPFDAWWERECRNVDPVSRMRLALHAEEMAA